MRKYLVILALFALPVLASAQSSPFVTTTGIVHNIADAYLTAADSVHTIGIVSMYDDDGTWVDSLNIVCTAEDSLNIRYFVVPYDKLKSTTVADSVAGVAVVTNVELGGYTMAGGGRCIVPWHNIVAAIKPSHQFTQFMIYARVYAVGSEVASSGKKFRTVVKRFE